MMRRFQIIKTLRFRTTSRALDGYVADTQWSVLDKNGQQVAIFDRRRDAVEYARNNDHTYQHLYS